MRHINMSGGRGFLNGNNSYTLIDNLGVVKADHANLEMTYVERRQISVAILKVADIYVTPQVYEVVRAGLGFKINVLDMRTLPIDSPILARTHIYYHTVDHNDEDLPRLWLGKPNTEVVNGTGISYDMELDELQYLATQSIVHMDPDVTTSVSHLQNYEIRYFGFMVNGNITQPVYIQDLLAKKRTETSR